MTLTTEQEARLDTMIALDSLVKDKIMAVDALNLSIRELSDFYTPEQSEALRVCISTLKALENK